MSAAGNETAHSVKLQVAEHVVKSVRGITVDSNYLASVIQEITPETQISGASLLHLYIIDPYWIVQRSGLLDTDPATGELKNDVEVNFPEGSSLWWRLAMIDGGNDLSDANLELTFIDRAVAYMQDDWGPLAVAPGTRTRAQFVKQLVDRVAKVLHVTPIKFVCPELNQIQPVASSTANSVGTAVLQNATSTSTKANKSKGLGAGAAVTIKGQTPTSTQLALINQVMGIANGLNAGTLATEALLEACIQENDFTNNPGGGGGSNGLLQLIPSTAAQAGVSALDVNGVVTAFLTNGYNPHGGTGAIGYAKANPSWSPDNVAQHVQNSGAGASFYAQWLSEAQAIIAAFGGVSSGNLGGASGSGTSDVSQLTRGTPQNPDEDSWTCGQRLASEVNWNLFSNGDFMYYMDGPDLVAQQPALYLRLSDDGISWIATDPSTGRKKAENSASRIITNLTYTVDNTAFQYQSTHKRRGKTQRKTAIRKPQTASQVKFNMVCGIFEFRAGDVFVIQDAGALNGRWIVEDTTRNSFADQHTQFTLGPPTIPYPEPQATNTTGGSPTTPGGPVSGQGFAGVAGAAEQALARQRSGHMFHYSKQRPIQFGILTDSPVNIDCSGFAIACFKAAGLSDPSFNNYNGAGFTGDMITHCIKVDAGSAQPGDLCFFGGSESDTTHVNVYVGNGQSISMGSEGEPAQGPAASMGPSGFLGYYHSTVPGSGSPAIDKVDTNAGQAGPPGPAGPAGALGNAVAGTVGGIDTWLFGPPPGPAGPGGATG